MDEREELLGDLALLIKRCDYDDDGYLSIDYSYERIGNNYNGDYDYNVYTLLLKQLLRKLNYKILNIEQTYHRNIKEDKDFIWIRYDTSIHRDDIEPLHIYYDKYNIRSKSRVIEIHKD
jgi:hypothetical protein